MYRGRKNKLIEISAQAQLAVYQFSFTHTDMYTIVENTRSSAVREGSLSHTDCYAVLRIGSASSAFLFLYWFCFSFFFSDQNKKRRGSAAAVTVNELFTYSIFCVFHRTPSHTQRERERKGRRREGGDRNTSLFFLLHFLPLFEFGYSLLLTTSSSPSLSLSLSLSLSCSPRHRFSSWAS